VSSPPASELVALVCCDLGAVVRGRSVPAAELDRHLDAGIGWVPANLALTPLGPLADPNPFGSLGDLRLLPDPATRMRAETGGASVPLELILCDIVETDGRPFSCCPRAFLRDTLELLERVLGASVSASFEHEFQLRSDEPAELPFSLAAQRTAEPFPAAAMQALSEAGVEPERVFAEFASHQFEIPVAPAGALAAADRAVVFREVVRDVARRQGKRATFVPLLDVAEAGNGVHVHFDLEDESGDSLLHDPARDGEISGLGGAFAAGIIRHARALSALSAPSPVSAERLKPHHWSAGAACVGLANREALVRIPAAVSLGGGDAAQQFHFEYRGADAAANPHIALACILRAGLAGVEAELQPPELLEEDPAGLTAELAQRFGIGAMPKSLAESMQALAEDDLVCGWLPPLLYDAYASVKSAEIQATSGLELSDVCERYAAIY
jgi:glutamine synthetase